MSWVSSLIKSGLRAIFIMILFIVLSPGLILTVPGTKGAVDFMARTTSIVAIILHAVAFTITFFGIDYLVSTLIFSLF
jgi:hypothetical protein